MGFIADLKDKYDNEEKSYIYQKHYLKNDEEMLYCSIDGISYDYYLIPPIDKIYRTYNKGITDKIDIHKIEKFYISIKLNTNNVSKIKIGDNNLILFNDFLVISDNEYIKLFESNFAFIQTKDEKYNNFIIYPKIIGKNNQYNNLTGEISYWVNEEFRLSLFVNNKWYFHEFKTSISEPNIKVGKLEYKYWNNDFNISSNFKQIRGFEKYGDREIVKFNAFAHEPDLFNVNNINFYNDYIKYCINNNLQYINKNYINNDDFYQIILLNNQKIRFHKSLYQRNFYFSSSLLNNENISSIYIVFSISGSPKFSAILATISSDVPSIIIDSGFSALRALIIAFLLLSSVNIAALTDPILVGSVLADLPATTLVPFINNASSII